MPLSHKTKSSEGSGRSVLVAPLRPHLEFRLTGSLAQLLESASLALGRLNGTTHQLTDEAFFINAYARKEAVHSCQIDGSRATLSDLLLFEAGHKPGAPKAHVRKVSNLAKALHYGLGQLRAGSPLSNQLLREVHERLMRPRRKRREAAGEFRSSGSKVKNTDESIPAFVPPPPSEVPECMADLEEFIQGDHSLAALVKAGLAHFQLEAIHPFKGGNGRLGRLLIIFMLCEAGLLRAPLLYLSLSLNQHRSDYLRLLGQLNVAGGREEWLAFFLRGVCAVADDATEKARRLSTIFAADQERIRKRGGRKTESVLQLHELLKKTPILSIRQASDEAQVTYPTAKGAMAVLVEQGIAREVTGAQRNRLYAYGQCLRVLE